MSPIRRVLVAVAVLAALVGVYMAIRERPSQAVTPRFAIAAIERVGRVEITPPDAPTIRLEARGEPSAWAITAPIQAMADDEVGRELSELFASEIRADDLTIPERKAAEYVVDEAHGVRVRVYAAGSNEPAQELIVGETIMVPETPAARTIVPIDRGERLQLSRVQANLGALRPATLCPQ